MGMELNRWDLFRTVNKMSVDTPSKPSLNGAIKRHEDNVGVGSVASQFIAIPGGLAYGFRTIVPLAGTAAQKIAGFTSTGVAAIPGGLAQVYGTVVPFAGTAAQKIAGFTSTGVAAISNGLHQAGDIAQGTAVGAGFGTAVPFLGTAWLNVAGFAAAGITKASLAAGIQSFIGNVPAGSLFTMLQSTGATGGVAILGPVGIGAAAVGVTGFVLYKRHYAKL